MKALLALLAVAGLLLVGSLFWAAVTDMCKDEIRTRLDRLPYLLIRVAAQRTPSSVRGDLTDEWSTELGIILRDTEGLPLTRLVRGVSYSADLMLRGAPAVAREMTATARAGIGLTPPEPAEVADRTWSELFPDGRHIFYEGNDPARLSVRLKLSSVLAQPLILAGENRSMETALASSPTDSIAQPSISTRSTAPAAFQWDRRPLRN